MSCRARGPTIGYIALTGSSLGLPDWKMSGTETSQGNPETGSMNPEARLPIQTLFPPQVSNSGEKGGSEGRFKLKNSCFLRGTVLVNSLIVQ